MRFGDLPNGTKFRYLGGERVMMKFRDGRAVSEEVMVDVQTTAHDQDSTAIVLRLVDTILKSHGFTLIGIVAVSSEGVNIFRAPGVPFSFSEVLLRALDTAGMMKPR